MDINVTGTWNTVMADADKIIEAGRGGSISTARGDRWLELSGNRVW